MRSNFKNSLYTSADNNLKKKKDFDTMIEAISMIALKHKVNVKAMNHEQVLNFVERRKNEINDEFKIIEENKKNRKEVNNKEPERKKYW